MCTGIIEAQGRISARRAIGDGVDLEIEVPELAAELEIGQSVAVNGACLTVTTHDARTFRATAVSETMRRTAFKDLRVGSRVNLERSLRLGDRVDGHMVQGHVDGIGVVRRIEQRRPGAAITIAVGQEIRKYIARKGSVAVDGVSLTVADIAQDGFSVALVPYTLEITTLGALRVGHSVNVEVDMMARYIERFMVGER